MIDRRYLAGVLDADGSFSIVRKSDRRNRSGLTFPVFVCLTWKQTPAAEALIAELVEHYGGSVWRGRGGHLGMTQVVAYRVSSRKALRLIEDVLPHLRLKAEQARTCLEHGRRQAGRSKWTSTAATHAENLDAAARVVALNRG